jgi:hypothetical protein
LALSVSFGLLRRSSLESEVNARCGRALERVVAEVRGTGSGSFAQDLTTPPGLPPVWSRTLDFSPGADWVDDAVVWGDQRRLDLELGLGELDNGLDDDGDGLIDEHRLVLTLRPGQIDEARVVIVNDVAELLEGELWNGADDNGNGLVDERGFCVALDEAGLCLRLTIQRATPRGEVVVRTQTDTLFLRN